MAAQQYQYRRAAHAGKLTGVALEVADKARVTGKPLPDFITLNPVGLGYFPFEEMKATQKTNKQRREGTEQRERRKKRSKALDTEQKVTSALEPRLPRLLQWAAAATAAIEKRLEREDVYLRGPYSFRGLGDPRSWRAHKGPRSPGGAGPCASACRCRS